MRRRLFSPTEVAEALQALTAGVRVPEVCHRFGVSELTLSRWQARAGMLQRPMEPMVPVPLTVGQAANRIAGLERRLEAFREVLVTMLEPAELEQAASLLQSSLSVSTLRARHLLGLPPRKRSRRPPRDTEGAAETRSQSAPRPLLIAKKS